MLRGHAQGFRIVLMLADATLAAGLLVGLSMWRFGGDWAVWWRTVVAEPVVFVAIYALGWVLVLLYRGLYRPRAHWSIRSEAVDIIRATVLMAALTFSVLFLFKLPDISRLVLLLLFPTQALATVVERSLLRRGMEMLRR